MSQPSNQYDFSKLNELQAQAMLLDMELDYETFDLVAIKRRDDPEWLIRWKDQQDQADFDSYFDIDREEIEQ